MTTDTVTFETCKEAVRQSGLGTNETVELMTACHEMAVSRDFGMGAGVALAGILLVLVAVPVSGKLKEEYEVKRKDGRENILTRFLERDEPIKDRHRETVNEEAEKREVYEDE